MIRISVDQQKCAGHARCYALAPEIYPVDDVGYTALSGVVEVDDLYVDRARSGAAACPEGVITILDH